MTLLDRNPDFAAAYARQLAGRMFNKRVSTIYDPRFSERPWTAFWDDYKDGDYMARGRNEAEAIRHLIEEARRRNE